MNPTVAGTLRGVVLAAGLFVVDAVIKSVMGPTFDDSYPQLAAAQPVILLVLRAVEGAIDHALGDKAPLTSATPSAPVVVADKPVPPPPPATLP